MGFFGWVRGRGSNNRGLGAVTPGPLLSPLRNPLSALSYPLSDSAHPAPIQSPESASDKKSASKGGSYL